MKKFSVQDVDNDKADSAGMACSLANPTRHNPRMWLKQFDENSPAVGLARIRTAMAPGRGRRRTRPNDQL